MIKQSFVFRIREDEAFKVARTKPEKPPGIWVVIDPHVYLARIDLAPSVWGPADFLNWGEGPWVAYGKEVQSATDDVEGAAQSLYAEWKQTHKEGYKVLPFSFCRAENGRTVITLDENIEYENRGWIWMEDPPSEVEKVLLYSQEVDPRLAVLHEYLKKLNAWLSQSLYTTFVGASIALYSENEISHYRWVKSNMWHTRQEAEAEKNILQEISNQATHLFSVTVTCTAEDLHRETGDRKSCLVWCKIPDCSNWLAREYYAWLMHNWEEVKKFNHHLDLRNSEILGIYITWSYKV